ncbi:hypothetical protein [Rhizobium sp. RU36D]|uniref:hypothetical protein n=1 Tax=Rhizobium sp. RU36D TaxID=1907415 RepID=UPI00117B2255|nr:hypothetical protein [Rhizobium sp. RU36D]
MPMPSLPMLLCLLVIGTLGMAGPAQTQTETQAQPQTRQQSTTVGPKGVVLGRSCTRRTDRFPGVIKVDACGRWYCGRVDINDITVLNPHLAEDMKCNWTLIYDKCKCLR